MTTLYARTPAPATLPPPRLGRLSLIELRKATDTRAGRWLIVVIVLLVLIVAFISALAGKHSGHTLPHILSNACTVTALFVPLLGIMLVTSEWSQHTALTTFTLVARRGRVIAAKMIAGALLALAAAIACAAAAVAGTAMAAHPPGTRPWAMAASVLANSVVFQVLNVLLGVGFGLVFRYTPVAITVYLVLPTAWSILSADVGALHSAGNWLDTATAWNHLTAGTMTPAMWAQAAATAAVWVVLPLLAGSVRVQRSMIT